MTDDNEMLELDEDAYLNKLYEQGDGSDVFNSNNVVSIEPTQDKEVIASDILEVTESVNAQALEESMNEIEEEVINVNEDPIEHIEPIQDVMETDIPTKDPEVIQVQADVSIKARFKAPQKIKASQKK
jgi:hypothetical protein